MKEDYISNNPALSWFFYPLARMISKRVIGSGVSPTTITVAWIAVILIASVVHLTIDLGYYVFLVFSFAYFLDCLDGQVARDQASSSDVGKFLDDFGGDLFTLLFWVCYGAYMLPSASAGSYMLYLGVYVGVISILRPVMAYRISHTNIKNVEKRSRFGQGELRPVNYALRLFFSLWEFGSLMWPAMLLIILMDFELIYLMVAGLLATLKFVNAFLSHIKIYKNDSDI